MPTTPSGRAWRTPRSPPPLQTENGFTSLTNQRQQRLPAHRPSDGPGPCRSDGQESGPTADIAEPKPSLVSEFLWARRGRKSKGKISISIRVARLTFQPRRLEGACLLVVGTEGVGDRHRLEPCRACLQLVKKRNAKCFLARQSAAEHGS